MQSSDKVMVVISINISPKLAVEMVHEIRFLSASGYPALTEFAVAVANELKVCANLNEVILKGEQNSEKTIFEDTQKEDSEISCMANSVPTKQTRLFQERGSELSSKAEIDTMPLLGDLIVKVRCKKCRTLNAKDARRCRECRQEFYENDTQYQDALNCINRIEKNEPNSLSNFNFGCYPLSDKVQVRIEKNADFCTPLETEEAKPRLKLKRWKAKGHRY